MSEGKKDIGKILEEMLNMPLELIEENKKLKKKIDKLQKVIDLMAKHICDYGKVCTYNYGATRPEQWKEYFYKKVEEGND